MYQESQRRIKETILLEVLTYIKIVKTHKPCPQIVYLVFYYALKASMLSSQMSEHCLYLMFFRTGANEWFLCVYFCLQIMKKFSSS